MKKKILAALAGLLSFNILSALELVPTRELLALYLEQDSDLKNLGLELQKAKLNEESNQIDKGFSLKLSTGDMTFTFGDNNSFSVKPGVNASFPQLNNLGLNVNSQFSVNEGKTSFDSAGASLSVDIISSSKANRDINLLQQERKVLEAERNIRTRALDKEKSFYKNISSLLNSITSVLSKKASVFDDNVAFEKIKLQGYTADSPSYIKAELKLFSSQRDYEAAVHSLINDYKAFYISCGKEIEIPEDLDFTLLIPADIGQVEPLDITSFDKNSYKDIESILWTQKINQMTRDASTKLTLTANGGYSYRNNNGRASNTVNAGLSASYEGLGLNASVNLPVASSSSPSLTVGLTYSPNTFRKNEISDQLTQIAIEQEESKVAAAYSAYDTAVKERQLKLEDLLWNIQTNETNYQMYKNVENNMSSYYERGLVSQKDYVSAQNSTVQARVKQLGGFIDLIIYNNEVSAMFVGQEN